MNPVVVGSNPDASAFGARLHFQTTDARCTGAVNTGSPGIVNVFTVRIRVGIAGGRIVKGCQQPRIASAIGTTPLAFILRILGELK